MTTANEALLPCGCGAEPVVFQPEARKTEETWCVMCQGCAIRVFRRFREEAEMAWNLAVSTENVEARARQIDPYAWELERCEPAVAMDADHFLRRERARKKAKAALQSAPLPLPRAVPERDAVAKALYAFEAGNRPQVPTWEDLPEKSPGYYDLMLRKADAALNVAPEAPLPGQGAEPKPWYHGDHSLKCWHQRDDDLAARHVPHCICELGPVIHNATEQPSIPEAIEWRARYQEQHDIVARIWVQLGSPTYAELNGRSIYDLIDELKQRATPSPAGQQGEAPWIKGPVPEDGSVKISDVEVRGFYCPEDSTEGEPMPFNYTHWRPLRASAQPTPPAPRKEYDGEFVYTPDTPNNTPKAPAPAALAEALVDRETAQTILDLLNPLHGSLDKQTYDEKYRQNFDAPPDAEYAVDVTAQQERDLTQAVMILESRLSHPSAMAEAKGEVRDWLPIETAPRDGTAILVWLDDEGFCCKALWRKESVSDADGDQSPMWWIPEMDIWTGEDGLHHITHWMPLPTLRASGARGNGNG